MIKDQHVPVNDPKSIAPKQAPPTSADHAEKSAVFAAPVYAPVLHALEQLRRMHGGSQSQLMRCDDENYYVVKFQNNPQGLRILANELFAGRLASALHLPAPFSAIVQVDRRLVKYTDDLVIQLCHKHTKCTAGLQFGSQIPAYLVNGLVWDFLPDYKLQQVDNLGAYAGMFAFDKWTCNTDRRQTVFVHSFHHAPFHALMIDNGFCFNGTAWDFPDAPRRSFFNRRRVYLSVTGIKSFDPWLSSIESLSEKAIREIAGEVPAEWLDPFVERFEQMVGLLCRRKKMVRELIVYAAEESPEMFPEWQHAPPARRVRRAAAGRGMARNGQGLIAVA